MTQRIALSWGSWGCRKVTLIPSPLKWPPQASLGAFPSTVWKNWRWGIHGSTPQPRVKNTVNRNWKWESSRRLFPGANLVVRPALPSGKLTFFFLGFDCSWMKVHFFTGRLKINSKVVVLHEVFVRLLLFPYIITWKSLPSWWPSWIKQWVQVGSDTETESS